MKYTKRMNKYEKRQYYQDKLKHDMEGKGLYIYENNTKGDLELPKATASGLKRIPVGGRFQGDNYFMNMVKSHDLRYIREIVPAVKLNEEKKMAEKLILDQPDQVTAEGKVEHVVKEKPMELLNDNLENEKNKPDVLINENPIEGLEIILD